MDKTLATLEWSPTEELRITLQEYKGKLYLGARIWYQGNGAMLPGKQGMNIPVERLSEFDKVMRRGLDAAAKELKKGASK